ncbi:MAG TPA: uracil-DNA glycosylase family protein [Candidatus Saccharimonadales bacterium]|jgi:uracil-DNA glycosylase family 4|nr:uracil-DNA glycosylase family protein [Candidatus Saccharimonadales bacterium]
MTSHPQRSATDAAKLKRLHARIRACTKCVAAGYLDMAAPVVAGDIADRVLIVGQAPGIVELTTRTPFSGRAGAELRRWLARAGIGEDDLPYRTAITKCFPGKASAGAGDRRPSPPEIALCRPWLEAELALMRPEIILLVGTLAIDRLWGKAALSDVVGRSKRSPRLNNALLIPLPHPSGASRWLNDPANRAQLDSALRLLGRSWRALPALDGAGRVHSRR